MSLNFSVVDIDTDAMEIGAGETLDFSLPPKRVEKPSEDERRRVGERQSASDSFLFGIVDHVMSATERREAREAKAAAKAKRAPKRKSPSPPKPTKRQRSDEPAKPVVYQESVSLADWKKMPKFEGSSVPDYNMECQATVLGIVNIDLSDEFNTEKFLDGYETMTPSDRDTFLEGLKRFLRNEFCFRTGRDSSEFRHELSNGVDVTVKVRCIPPHMQAGNGPFAKPEGSVSMRGVWCYGCERDTNAWKPVHSDVDKFSEAIRSRVSQLIIKQVMERYLDNAPEHHML